MEIKLTPKARLLTIKEASEVIDGLTPHRVRQLIKGEEIKYKKFGSKYMILESELLKYFEVCTG